MHIDIDDSEILEPGDYVKKADGSLWYVQCDNRSVKDIPDEAWEGERPEFHRVLGLVPITGFKAWWVERFVFYFNMRK